MMVCIATIETNIGNMLNRVSGRINNNITITPHAFADNLISVRRYATIASIINIPRLFIYSPT